MVVLHTSSLAEFDRLKSSNTYLVADFYADWCGPCHAIKPMYENLANTHGQPGQLVFVKVNVDSATDIARRYGVTAMPTFMFFENGEPYNGGRGVIRGADPRSLQATVQELAQLARNRPPTRPRRRPRPRGGSRGRTPKRPRPSPTTDRQSLAATPWAAAAGRGLTGRCL